MNWQFLISIMAALWAGFVLAISFMESWLKFRAAGVTLAIGLSIGRLVFKALNLVEWTIFIFICFALFECDFNLQPQVSLVSMLLGVLLLQTFILLPVLSRRALLLISNRELARSSAHLLFVIAEIVKIILLGFLIFSGNFV
jgi:uncharacterized membrane protein (DUF485 family)